MSLNSIKKQWISKSKQDKKLIIVMFTTSLLMLMLIIFIKYAPIKIFYINGTESAPLGLYVRFPSQIIKKGDYVIIPTKDRLDIFTLKHKPTFLLKHVVCLPGEEYKVTENALETKDIKLPFYKESKIKLPKLKKGNYKLNKDEYLLANTPLKSYDSRYFGAIKKEEIKKVVPLFTWTNKKSEVKKSEKINIKNFSGNSKTGT
ncbi:S26 family signal peptidase [Dialister micraerophilus]|uniref:S26 family signal peptidase n=1 Tax=Dialister micraerophilus TaxID=309120 RepID=UPI0023F10DEB|nr:S26 family signal peptidase [Dialister micraerophilus]